MKNTLLGDEFLWTCKKNYLEKITPSNKNTRSTVGYKKIVSIANNYFEKDEYRDFAEFFKEEKYFVPLWAAHMLLEYGNPPDQLIIESLKVIENYLDNPLAPEVSKEEKNWLDDNKKLYEDKF